MAAGILSAPETAMRTVTFFFVHNSAGELEGKFESKDEALQFARTRSDQTQGPMVISEADGTEWARVYPEGW